MHSSESTTTTVNAAEGFKAYLEELQFVFLLAIFEEIFQKTELLFQILQKKTNDVQFCIKAVSECMLYIRELRSEEKYRGFIESAEHGTGLNVLTSLKRHEQKENNASSKYKQVYYEILDNIHTQMEVRFSNLEKLTFLKLGDTSKFVQYHIHFPNDAILSLMENYGTHFKKERLTTELKTIFSPFMDTYHELSLGDLIKKMIAHQTHTILSEAYKLFCLIATIPATSSSVERSFSCLKRVKTYLRNSMTQQRVNSLAYLSIEKSILCQLEQRSNWHDGIIDKYGNRKERRVNLLYQ
jgi:hypothetical protein